MVFERLRRRLSFDLYVALRSLAKARRQAFPSAAFTILKLRFLLFKTAADITSARIVATTQRDASGCWKTSRGSCGPPPRTELPTLACIVRVAGLFLFFGRQSLASAELLERGWASFSPGTGAELGLRTGFQARVLPGCCARSFRASVKC